MNAALLSNTYSILQENLNTCAASGHQGINSYKAQAKQSEKIFK